MSRPSDREKTAHLAADLPGIDVRRGDAHQLPALLTEAGIARADAIITSLPWTLLAHRQRDALLDAITTALARRDGDRRPHPHRAAEPGA